jgi:histidyl-tRNA synthetase
MDRLPGFRDFYPEPLPARDAWSADLRRHIFETWRRVAVLYGFREYDGPPLESLELYTAKSGDEIVGQLYCFEDKGGRRVALRPEVTPTLARMIGAHERQYKKPIKWFCLPQLFRYERQQKGRLREHFQFNADVIGEADAAADAELIALLIDSLRALGLTAGDFVIRLSSRNAWQEFFAQRCSDRCRAYEFYQVVDKLERQAPEVSERKLEALGIAFEEVRAFIAGGEPTEELDSIRGNLGARGLGDFVKIDYGVIRGLAYYTGPVFEAFDRQGEFRAIAGGGRYDQLVRLISGGKVDLPALGFGMGDVVLTELLRARNRAPASLSGVQVYFLVEDESLRAGTLEWVQRLRDAGFSVDYPFTRLKPDKQFKRARELGSRFTLALQRHTAGALTARMKELAAREEKTVALPDLIGELTRALR